MASGLDQMYANMQRQQQEALKKQNEDWYKQNTSFGDWQLSPDGTTYLNTKTGERLNDAGFQSYISKQREEQAIAEKEAKRVADMRAQGLNPDGSPIAPEYDSMIDPATGKLKDQFQLQLERIDPDKLVGYNMIKELATRKGPSDWANAANQQAELSKQDAIDSGVAQQAGANAQALGQLGMRGGYSGGARERLAMQGQRDIFGGKQAAFRQKGNSLLEIMKQDEDAKRAALNTFASAEGNLVKYNTDTGNRESEYNIGNVLKDFGDKNNWQMDKYKEALDKWAANKQAEATARSGGGGGK